MTREEKARAFLNAQHRMLELGLTNVDLACLVGSTRQTMHDRLSRMSKATRKLLEVLLVLPPGALESASAVTAATFVKPNMYGWHACMNSVIRNGEPYPSCEELIQLCDAFAMERERGVVLETTEL